MNCYLVPLSVAASLIITGLASGQTSTALPFRPIDAEYSSSLDRIIMISASPNQLHIYNPVSKADTIVNLAAAPLTVSVSPDGRFAAAGHSGSISYVDLANGQLLNTFTGPFTASDVVLTADYVYAPPRAAIRLATGAIMDNLSATGTTYKSRLGSDGAIYSFEYNGQSSPGVVARRTVAGSTIGAPLRTPTPYYCVSDTQKPLTIPGYVVDRCNNYWTNGQLKHATMIESLDPDLAYFIGAFAYHGTGGFAGAVQAPITASNRPDWLGIHLFGRDFPPVPRGKLRIPDVTIGGVRYFSWTKWLFFDSTGQSIHAIYQPVYISSPGVVGEVREEYTLYSATLPGTGAAPACQTSVTPSRLAVRPAGDSITARVSSTDCAYRADTSASWIVVPAPVGAGSTPLNLQVRPNLTGSPRTGTVTIGSSTLTIAQEPSPSAVPELQHLSFTAEQAEYSKPLERLVLTATSPNELHIFDPLTRADTIVPLSFRPRTLSLSADGLSAGLGGNGMMAVVNLTTGALTGPYRTNRNVASVSLPGDGYAYLTGETEWQSSAFSRFRSLAVMELASGNTPADVASTVGAMRLQPPAGRYGYANINGGIAKLDFGTAGAVPQLLGSTATCLAEGPSFWLAEDGARLFASCPSVYRTTANSSPVLNNEGSFFASNDWLVPPNWVGHSQAAKAIGVIPSSFLAQSVYSSDLVTFYSENSLASLGQLILPPVEWGTQFFPANGQFLFWNAAGDRLFVVENAWNFRGAWTPSAVYTVSTDACAPSATAPASAALGREGGGGVVAVTATCAWKARSNAAWLTVTGGGFGVGSANVSYSATGNDTGASRTGTISIGSRTFTVTQSTSAGTVALSPASGTHDATGGTGTITVTTNPTAGVTWSAYTPQSWIQITAGGAGAGAGTVSYRVLPNASSLARAGSVFVNNVEFAVAQSAAPAGQAVVNGFFSAGKDGGTYTLSVSATGTWVAASQNSWIRIVTPAGGASSGAGLLTIAVDRNPGADYRRGSVALNGVLVGVTQEGQPFEVTADRASVNFGASGGSGTFRLTTNSPTQGWIPYASASWISVDGATQSGDRSITFSVSANTSVTPRSGTINVWTAGIQVFQAGVAAPPPPLTSGLHFVPVTPCRIADTREASRPAGFGTPTLAGGVARSFVIPAAGCGVPSNAKAYSMNVTVVPKGPLGYITIWPTGQNQPFVSTLNSADGRVKANAAIVPAGSGGAVSVMATEATELVLDINGYFIEPNLNPAGLAFYPITPCRIADTRNANGGLGGPAIGAGATRNFPVQSAGCAVPANAQAYSMNATVVPGGAPLGYISMWPTGQAQPFVSTLNAPTGAIVANAAIVPAGSNGEISVFAQGQTHLVLDINGYFAPAGGTNEQRFYPIVPCRLADTREANGDFGGPVLAGAETRNFPLGNANCGFPAAARAYSLNATVVPATVLGYLTLWATGQAQPFVSTLNVTDDKIVANAAIVPAGTTGGGVSGFVTNQTHLILDTNGYFAP